MSEHTEPEHDLDAQGEAGELDARREQLEEKIDGLWIRLRAAEQERDALRTALTDAAESFTAASLRMIGKWPDMAEAMAAKAVAIRVTLEEAKG